MALIDDHIIEVVVSGGGSDAAIFNVIHYHVDSGVVGATGATVGEAWWSSVKTWWRGVCSSAYDFYFRQVLVRDITDLAGLYGVYAIPLSEQAGLRTTPAFTDGLPKFLAMSIRMNVATRATRPGQKRLAGFHEADQTGGQFVTSVITAGQAWGDEAIETITLPAPAALGVLTPVVVRKNADGTAGVWQPMTSATVNTQVSSQVSRKPGRGL